MGATAVTYKLTLLPTDFTTSSYADNNGDHSKNAVCTTDNTKTMSVTYYTNSVYQNSSSMQFKSDTGILYNKTDLGTIVSVNITSSSSFTTYYGTTMNPSSGTDVTGGFFKIKAGSSTPKATKIEITFTVNEASSYPLASISLSGTYPTTFTEKEAFSHEGMTVTAHYTGTDETQDVTSTASFSGYNMDNIGNQTVTVSYTEGEVTKTVTYVISVNAGPKYKVTYNAGSGSCAKGSDTELEYQGGVTLPSATINMAGWVFAGWATEAVSNTSNRPTLYPANSKYYPTANVELHAVYTLEDALNKYKEASSNDDIVNGKNVVITSLGNYKYTLANNNGTLTGITNFTPTDGVITCTNANAVWTLSINSGKVTLSNNGKFLKRQTESVSAANDATKWTINKSTYGTNRFLIKDASYNYYLEYGSSGWKAYNTSSVNSNNVTNYIGLTIYVEVDNVYNSNPSAAVAEPTVTFTSKDTRTIYLDGTTTYQNLATVTGINKTVTYESSDEDVAEVAADGTVTAKAIGTTTITAKVAAELGVNKYAADTYDVVVKNTTNIAGIKNLVSTLTVVDFSADLTDAVVTYVNGNYAYIQDATAAIMVNASNHGLTAGKKINGAVSGKVKAPYQMDQITMITVSEELTDADVPAAEVKTLAQIAANATYYDGKKVTVNAATATDNGLKITDDNGTTKFSLETPKNNITINETEIGNYTGFVSIYVNGDNTTYRLNLYEEGQYVKTQNQATDQILSFDEEDVQLDEETSTLTAYRGETVKGAFTTVTYSVDDSSDDIIDEFNAETGVLKLNGSCGMAIINVSAAAENIVSEGVTTPYNEANASYTITVNPRYSVVFSINGVETTMRQDTHGAAINVPTLTTIGTYNCVGWSINEVAATNDEPSFAEIGSTVVPSDNNGKYYAVFAIENKTTGNVRMTITPDTEGVPSSYGTANTFREVTLNGKKFMVQQMFKGKDTSNNPILQWRAGGNSEGTGTMYNKDALTKIQSIVLTYHSNDNYKNFTLKVGDSANPTSGTEISPSISSNVYTFDCSSYNKDYFVLTNGSYAGYLDEIEINYKDEVITYSDYRTSIPPVSVTVTSAKYATFSNAGATDFSQTGIKVYKAKVENEVVRLTEIVDGIVPAKTGVILYSETAVTTDVPFISNNTTVSENELVATYERTLVKTNPEGDNTKFNYIMQLSEDGKSIVFNKALADGAYMPAGRAYLSTTVDASATDNSRLMVVFGDDASGIEGTLTSNENVNGVVYNLKGQRVMNPAKGNLYIVNGKKVFIK